MTINRIKQLVQDDFERVNELIIDKIHSQIGLIDDLSHHIVKSGGKRLRPLLVLLASRACRYEGSDHITLATMIEFFHTATLLHDDVVDESTLRRGRETANAIWGSKASILVGDYLLTQSVQLMVSVRNWKIMDLLSATSHQISCGEVKQLINRHNFSLTISDYLEVILSKTAVLFAASASIGGIITNSGDAIEHALYQYGLHLGNAFQLIDDALDYCSDPNTIGKNIGDDLADGKATMPLIFALHHGTATQKDLIESSLQEGSLAHLNEILTAIYETNAIEFTKNYAREQVEIALKALEPLPESSYKTGLKELALFTTAREY